MTSTTTIPTGESSNHQSINNLPSTSTLSPTDPLIIDLDPCSPHSPHHQSSPNQSSTNPLPNPSPTSQSEENIDDLNIPRDLSLTSSDSNSNLKPLNPSDQQDSTPSETSKPLVVTRNRASTWSNIFRRNSASNETSGSLGSVLLTKLASQPSPSTTAPISTPSPSSSKPSHPSNTTPPGSFSLSSLASALTRPLNLNSAPTTTRPPYIPSPAESPSDSKSSTHELSSKDADPDPTPSVPPPKLVIDSPSEETVQVPFDFNLFLEQMRWPQAEPIAKYLRSFLKEFTKRATNPSKPTSVTDQVKVVNDFLDFISLKMRDISDGPWNPKNCSDAEFDNAIEAMEKLVMNRVWHLTFTPGLSTPQPSQTDDLERDAVLSQKMNLFSWLTDRHLDLNLPPDEADGFLEFAKSELLKINAYKAPRDKMICILNCSKVIFGLIRHVDQSEGGADTFIPILILVVLRAQPENLISNVQYIQRFRNPDKMQGENGYYLSSLNAAISFIERLEHSVLSNITQSEFEFNVEQAINRLPRSPSEEFKTTSSVPLALSSTGSSPKMAKEPQGGEMSKLSAKPMSKAHSSPSIPDLTRSWLFTTVPQFAEKAVSKPLNAIARIVDDLASESDESRAGYGNESERLERQNYRRASSSNLTSQAAYETTDSSGSRRRGSRRGNRPWSMDSPRSRHKELGGALPQPPSSPPDRMTEEAQMFDEDLKRIEVLKQAEHQAKLETLKSIFPKLELELLEVVLITHRGVISKAIDSLLEMS